MTKLNNDVVAVHLASGRYRIHRWRVADDALLPIAGYEETYEEAEMLRRLTDLRSEGDTWVREQNGTERLIE
jgi:hypothetical protein